MPDPFDVRGIANVTDGIQILLAAAPAADQPGNPMGSMLMMFVLIALAFYFIIIRPQRREQHDKQRMLETLEKGDRIVTIGGIHGVVAGVDATKQIVSVDVGKNVRIDFSRNAVSQIEKRKRPSEEAPANQ